MLSEIKAIIFDLGGVILNIDYHRSVQAFHDLGLRDFDAFYSQQNQTELFDLLETGKIAPDFFRAEMRKLLPAANDEQLDKAWNAIIGDFPEGRLEWIATMRLRYRCFLLSNTNAIHTNHFNEILAERHGVSGVHALFDKAYLSHEVGLRKPGHGIFEHVLRDQQLLPHEVIFIDDSEQHVRAAMSLGIAALHLRSIHDLDRQLHSFLAQLDEHPVR